MNDRLKKKGTILWLFLILTLFYYATAIATPVFVTYKNFDLHQMSGDNDYDHEKVCNSGVGIIALIIYFCFALISVIIELYLFIYVYRKIGNLLPNPIEIKDYDKNKVHSKFE